MRQFAERLRQALGARTGRARVEFDHVRRTWLLDSYEVRSERFTLSLRR